jgi:hypothetical protein
MGAIKIRDLTVADRDLISDLIKKLVVEIGSNEILRMMVSDSAAEEKKPDGADGQTGVSDKKYALLVIEIIKKMIEVMGGDVRQWFASLIGVTPEEFKALPFDTEVTIIEQLVAVEESNRFFSRVLALSSKIRGFVPGLSAKKGQ